MKLIIQSACALTLALAAPQQKVLRVDELHTASMQVDAAGEMQIQQTRTQSGGLKLNPLGHHYDTQAEKDSFMPDLSADRYTDPVDGGKVYDYGTDANHYHGD